MLHLNEFLREEFQGYIEHVPPEREYPLANVMPNKQTWDLRFVYNIIDKKYARTASITGFDAGAPLRDKEGLSRAFAEVIKVQHGFRLSEEELIKFHRPRAEAEQTQAIEYVYDQTDNLVQGVYDIEEWMRGQAVYRGGMNYEEDDVKINVDFQIPEDNKMGIGEKWDTANGTPLQDIREAVEQYQEENKMKKPNVIHMSSKVEAKLLENEEIKENIFADYDKRLMTREDLMGLFNRLGFPPYAINDDIVNMGGADYERILPEDRVVLLGTELGSLMEGPTVENNYEPGIYVIPEIRETNPPQQAVYVGKTIFPALEQPQSIVWIDEVISL